MIHINLLPEEYRRRARTPVKITLATAGVVGANALLLTWFSWLALGVMAEIDGEREVLQDELDGLTPQVAYHKGLEAERKSFAAREETLEAITGNRILWTRKVDELVTVINSGGGGDRHYVWLDDLNVSQSTDPRAQIAGSVRASGHSGSEKFDQIANFLEDIERSPFIVEFQPPAPPAGTQSKVDKELIPAVVWSFPLDLNIKTLEERLADRKLAVEQSANPKDPDSGAQPKGQPKPGAQPKGQPESEVQPKPKATPEAQPKAQAKPEAEQGESSAPSTTGTAGEAKEGV